VLFVLVVVAVGKVRTTVVVGAALVVVLVGKII
jgi:hypothetical protein